MANINNSKSNKLLSGTSDNDFIYNSGSKITISGGAGDDYIQNLGGSNVSINGGAGNDSIYDVLPVESRSDASSGKNVTINGGAGNDSIASASNRKHVFEYNPGDGNDFIFGFNSNDTLQVNALNYGTAVSGDDVIVYVGTGAVILKNSANIPVKIRNSSGVLKTYNENAENVLNGSIFSDEIMNTNKGAIILGWSGNDTILNVADKVLISADEGYDYIQNVSDGVSIVGGNGADSIASAGDNGLIIGDAGNDTIIARGKGNTAIGGQGNDIISLDSANGGNVIDYGSGCGNDIIYGLKTNDTINFYSGYVSEVSVKGSDVIAKVGSYKITGVNLKGKIINITDWATGDYSVRVDSAKSISLFATDKTLANMEISSVIKNVDASKRTKAVQITGNAKNNSLVGSKGADTLSGGKGNDSLKGGE